MSWLSSLIGSFTGSNQRKAITQATAAQNAGDQQAIDEARRQFDITQGNLQPFITAGQQGVSGQQDILGLHGADTQTSALAGLKDSPLYQALYHNGEQAILANGSATGGLRGGNEQNSLAHFGTDVFAQLIQQQLANLGGLAGQGAGTGGTLGGLGAANSANIGNLFINQGQNTAGGILGKAASLDKTIGNFFGNFGQSTGGSSGGSGGLDFSSILKLLGSSGGGIPF